MTIQPLKTKERLLKKGYNHMNMTIDGYTFSEKQSDCLVYLVMKEANLNNINEVQEYLKGFNVQEMKWFDLGEITLRNPNGYGPNFSIRKDFL
ncbi:hypothetical protein AAYR26_14080 [Bacillus licheniformis]|uniref:hypothetical protein n=1 Tax=Bacillus licheniformis TaxID=1402 RepID=UPI0031F5B9CB